MTGGFVYRGSALPALVGSYLFADYGSGRIWRLVSNGSGGFTAQELLDTSLSIASFGQGNDGELYVVDIAGGGLYKIVDGGGAAPAPPVPTLLSDTGCVVAVESEPARLGPRSVRRRGGVLVRRRCEGTLARDPERHVDRRRRRRRLHVPERHRADEALPPERHAWSRRACSCAIPDGDWAGYTYEWNGQQTNATLVQGGKTVAVGGQSWIYPSGNDCLTCHTSAAGFALGLESAQLNHDFTYASTGRTANELRTLDNVVMFTTPLGDPAAQPKLAEPVRHVRAARRPRAGVSAHELRAVPPVRRPDGRARSTCAIRRCCRAPPRATCRRRPAISASVRALGSSRPGNPDASVLLARMNRRDANQMPPLASNVDRHGGRHA